MHMHGCVVQIGEIWLWYMSEEANLQEQKFHCAFISQHRASEIKILPPPQ